LQPNFIPMKNFHGLTIILLAAIVGLFASCQRYDMAKITIDQTSFNDTTRIVQYTAVVTDDGGCPRCIEAGYCYSYVDPMPSHTCYYSTVVPLVKDSMMTFTDSTLYLTYSWQRQLPFIESLDDGEEVSDTLLYFFRSYITTNAGTFYSSVDTVKVPRSY